MLDGNVTVTAVEWILRWRNAADKSILGKSTIILLKVSCEGYMQTSRCYGLHAALKQNPILLFDVCVGHGPKLAFNTSKS